MVQALAKQGIFQHIVEVSTFNHRYVMFLLVIVFRANFSYMLGKSLFSTNIAQDQENIKKNVYSALPPVVETVTKCKSTYKLSLLWGSFVSKTPFQENFPRIILPHNDLAVLF